MPKAKCYFIRLPSGKLKHRPMPLAVFQRRVAGIFHYVSKKSIMYMYDIGFFEGSYAFCNMVQCLGGVELIHADASFVIPSL